MNICCIKYLIFKHEKRCRNPKKMGGLKRQPILNDCGNWCGVKNYCVKTRVHFYKAPPVYWKYFITR